MKSEKLKELKIKYDKASERLKKACYECSPKRHKSKFITCRNCGSRYQKEFLVEYEDNFSACCVCGIHYSLYSATSIKRINNCKNKLWGIQERIDAEVERLEQSAHPNQSKFERSLNQARDEIEKWT